VRLEAGLWGPGSNRSPGPFSSPSAKPRGPDGIAQRKPSSAPGQHGRCRRIEQDRRVIAAGRREKSAPHAGSDLGSSASSRERAGLLQKHQMLCGDALFGRGLWTWGSDCPPGRHRLLAEGSLRLRREMARADADDEPAVIRLSITGFHRRPMDRPVEGSCASDLHDRSAAVEWAGNGRRRASAAVTSAAEVEDELTPP
jgi:hypothetical protein